LLRRISSRSRSARSPTGCPVEEEADRAPDDRLAGDEALVFAVPFFAVLGAGCRLARVDLLAAFFVAARFRCFLATVPLSSSSGFGAGLGQSPALARPAWA
jgi:hypothetical protein